MPPPSGPGQMFPIVFVSVVAFLIFWFTIGILICLWVYRDAESRGMDGALWLIIVIIANILGLIIYLIVREEKKIEPRTPPPPPLRRPIRFCSNCGRGISPDANFCPNCGKSTM